MFVVCVSDLVVLVRPCLVVTLSNCCRACHISIATTSFIGMEANQVVYTVWFVISIFFRLFISDVGISFSYCRDIKGANILVMPSGVLKLIDFGCAKRLYMVSLAHTVRTHLFIYRGMIKRFFFFANVYRLFGLKVLNFFCTLLPLTGLHRILVCLFEIV